MRWQDLIGGGNDADVEAQIGFAAVFEDARLGGAGEFDAGGPAADDGDAVAPALLEGCDRLAADAIPSPQKPVDGFNADGMLGGAGHGAGIGYRADIEREQVEVEFGPGWQGDGSGCQIDGFDLGLDQPGPGEARQRPQIDVQLFGPVAPGDIGGQGAGVGNENLAADQGDHQPRHRPHAEPAQHRQVAVPAANQQQMFDQWFGSLHGRPAPESRNAELYPPHRWAAKTENQCSAGACGLALG